MLIEITKDVRLRTDDHNYTLETRVVTRAHHRTKAENIGKERWVTQGYYSTLRAACHGILDRHAKHLLGDAEEEECKRSLRQLIERIDAIESHIIGLFDEQNMVLQERRDMGAPTSQIGREKAEEHFPNHDLIQLTPDDLRHLATGGVIESPSEGFNVYIELTEPPSSKKTIAGGSP